MSDTPDFSLIDCQVALKRVACLIGHAPSIREYDKHRRKIEDDEHDVEPSSRVIRNNYGTWMEALRDVRLNPRGIQVRMSNDEMIAAIREVAEKYCGGKAPTTREFDQHCVKCKSLSIRLRYRGWPNALKAAGYLK